MRSAYQASNFICMVRRYAPVSLLQYYRLTIVELRSSIVSVLGVYGTLEGHPGAELIC